MKFLKYEKASDGEKYLGIATISLYDKIVLKYKIVMKKDGSTFFPAAPSLKQPGTTDEYVSAFIIDSNSEKEDIEGFIRHHVKLALQQEHGQAQQALAPQSHTYVTQNGYTNTQPQYAQPQQQPAYGQTRPAPAPAQQSIFNDDNVPF